jgi:hypothetical protein
MTNNTTKPDSLQPAADKAVDLFDNWFDPIETEVRARSRQFIEELLRGELDAALARPRYERSQVAGANVVLSAVGHNFRRILAWFRDFWCLVLTALIHGEVPPDERTERSHIPHGQRQLS